MRRSSSRILAATTLAIFCFFGPLRIWADENATNDYMSALQADPARVNQLLEFLQQMPKGGDLHNHLAGAIYAESFIDWAATANLCVDPATFTLMPQPCRANEIPAVTYKDDPVLFRNLIDAFSMRNWKLSGQSGHDHFFDTFGKFGEVSGINYVGDMLAETANRAAWQGEIYQELMFGPSGNAFKAWLATPAVKGVKIPDLPDSPTPAQVKDARAALDALYKALTDNGAMAAPFQEAVQNTDNATQKRDQTLKCNTPAPDPGCRIAQRYIFQVTRGKAKENVFAQILLAFELASQKNPRFAGLNLVMPEDYYIPMRDFRLHMEMLNYLRNKQPQYKDVKLSLHAGELVLGVVPPEGLRYHVRDSVEVAGASRIGHGVDTLQEYEADELVGEMAHNNNGRGVMVEICLTSNDTILGVSGDNHPLHTLIARQVPVALATDDEGVSRSDMTHEYFRAATDQRLTYKQLKKMARTSLEYAFIPGNSIWQDARNFTPAPNCQKILADVKARGTSCGKRPNPETKPWLQCQLEEQFCSFEARTWPPLIATVGQTPAPGPPPVPNSGPPQPQGPTANPPKQ